MGIICSQVQFDIDMTDRNGLISDKLSVSNERLRLPLYSVRNVVAKFYKLKYTPIVSYIDLCGFFQNCVEANQQDLVHVVWKIFSLQSICYLQEVVVCLVLICDGQWDERLGLLFDIFKSHGTDEVSHDDIIMIVQIIAVALHKVWMIAESWKQSELNTLSEIIADNAYSKLGKEMEDGLTRCEFLNCMQERFKNSRTVGAPESLLSILTSPYE